MQKNRALSLTIATLLVTFSNLAYAGLLEFDSDTTITSSKKWTAGSDTTGQWYGSNFTVQDGSATLTESSYNKGRGRKVANSANSVLVAFDLSDSMVGSHNWSIDTLYNDYNTQYNYGQVYLMNDGQSISLDKGIWSKKTGGSSIVSQEYPRAGTGNLTWDTFGKSFDITQSQVNSYDYVALVFTGSKHKDQTLQFDNLSTSLYDTSKSAVPEPATVAFASLGALMLFKRKKTA